MHSFIEYVRRNIMFVVILTAIIPVTAGLVIYQMVLAAPTKGDTQEPADTTQSVEPGSSETAIVGFSGRMSSDDVIVLSWEIDTGDQNVISSALYYEDETKGDIWIADVTNHTSYQLSQDAYQFGGGENTFKIICTLENDEQISARTTVNIIQLEDVSLEQEATDEGIRLYLHYFSTPGASIDVPILSFYGNGATDFTVHYENTQRSEENGQVQTTVSYLLRDDGAPAGDYRFTLTFRFLQLNQSYEYTVRYEKQEETAPVEDPEVTEDEQPAEENHG